MELSQIKKADLIWMAKHKCKHGHSYITHPQCYALDHPVVEERVGIYDIECSNLSASFGIILSYAVKEWHGKVTGRCITPRELKSKDQDKALVKECIAELAHYDRLVGFYSSRFDGPFIRTRAMAHNLKFPGQGMAPKQTDLWFQVRGKMKLHSNRLQVACDFLGIPSKQHKLDGLLWTKALSGDGDSLKYIMEHNFEDVVSTEKLLDRLKPFFQFGKASL